MPILSVFVNQDPSPEQATRLLESTSQAVVDSVGAPLSNVRVTLHATPAQHAIVAGEQGRLTAIVHVYMLPGRSEAQREALLASLNAAVHTSLGVSTKEIRVMLHDIALVDMGMADGISAKKAGR